MSLHYDAVLRTASELAEFCRRTDWSGWDPYDGLNSRLFQALPFLQNKPARLAFIQFMKRSPVNFRPLFRVPRGRNPKGVALFATTLIKQHRLGLGGLGEAQQLVDSLIDRRCPGQTHFAWGYHFDWQTRGALVPATMPNIVCTTFVAHAFIDLYEATGTSRYLEIAASAGRYITDELAADLPEDAFCIRYYMASRGTVHNANLMGAALLARLYGHSREARLEPYIRKATEYSLRHQDEDGSWPYGELPGQEWVDSFHTGFNLLALKQVGRQLEIAGLPEAVRKGYAYYRAHFFREDGAVRYFDNRTYPIDAHAIGHAFITLAAFSREDSAALSQAAQCYDWALAHLRSPQGYFYYQKHPLFTNRIPYIRWSEAWMLLGLTCLLEVVAPAKKSD